MALRVAFVLVILTCCIDCMHCQKVFAANGDLHITSAPARRVLIDGKSGVIVNGRDLFQYLDVLASNLTQSFASQFAEMMAMNALLTNRVAVLEG